MTAHAVASRYARLVAGLAGALAVTSCAAPALVGAAPHRVTTPLRAPVRTPVPVMARAIPLPLGGSDKLLGDSRRAGVWFLSQRATTSALCFWNAATSALRSYPLGDPQTDNSLYFDLNTALAQDTSGNVWVGTGREVIEVDPVSGVVSRWPIPRPPDSAAAETPLPPEIRGTHEVDALAVSARGAVAIAMSNASAVAIFDPLTGHFSWAALRQSEVAAALAYAASGDLFVSTFDLSGAGANAIVVIKGTTVVAEATAGIDPQTLTGGVAGVDIAGVDSVDRVGDSGGVVPILQGLPAGTGSAAMAMLPDGRIVLPGRNAVVADPASGSITSLPLPPVTNCYPSEPRVPGSATPPPQSGVCPRSARAVASDAQGNLWILPGVGSVFEFPAGSF